MLNRISKHMLTSNVTIYTVLPTNQTNCSLLLNPLTQKNNPAPTVAAFFSHSLFAFHALDAKDYAIFIFIFLFVFLKRKIVMLRAILPPNKRVRAHNKKNS